MSLAHDAVETHVDDAWPAIVDTLSDYIRIPNVSPDFDTEWDANGYMEQAVGLIRDWVAAHAPDGAVTDVQRLPGRTPLVVCEIPATDASLADDTVLLYGHLDKQPEMTGWRDGLGPWTPVLDGGPLDGRLYGRGGADDGYAAFSAMAAIDALRANGGSHARLLVLIEASEESGSPDLPAHLDALGDRLGTVSLVIGLDSGSPTDDRLWVTTSLRGLLAGDLTVEVLTEGVHSGSAGGIVPSSFRILRRLLDRIEDPDTGTVLVPELACPIPDEREREMAEVATEIIGQSAFPWAGTTNPGDRTDLDLLRARLWEPAIANVAVGGMPTPERAGNVLRPSTTLSIAARLAPDADPEAATRALTETLEADPPHGATVRFRVRSAEQGWNAPPTAPWLDAALHDASTAAWGRPPSRSGEGGTIPFMHMLGSRFPDAQFLITGVLVPGSNAHGPNEFLDLPTARRVTTTVSHVLDAHTRRGDR